FSRYLMRSPWWFEGAASHRGEAAPSLCLFETMGQTAGVPLAQMAYTVTGPAAVTFHPVGTLPAEATEPPLLSGAERVRPLAPASPPPPRAIIPVSHWTEADGVPVAVFTTEVITPEVPVSPLAPADPGGPCGPTGPTVPCGPTAPALPWVPAGPVAPAGPAGPWGPAGPTGPWGPR